MERVFDTKSTIYLYGLDISSMGDLSYREVLNKKIESGRRLLKELLDDINDNELSYEIKSRIEYRFNQVLKAIVVAEKQLNELR